MAPQTLLDHNQIKSDTNNIFQCELLMYEYIPDVIFCGLMWVDF